MKFENLPFAILITAIAIVALAGCGWIVSHIYNVELTFSDPDGYSATAEFIARVAIGSAIIGALLTVWKLMDLFLLCMRYPGERQTSSKKDFWHD